MTTSPDDYNVAQSALIRLWMRADGKERAQLDASIVSLGNAWVEHKKVVA